jgi:hypothetical protein
MTDRVNYTEKAHPVPGDGGYREWLQKHKGAITYREYRASCLLHCHLFRLLTPPDPRGEAGFLSDLSALGATPVVEEAKLPCRYEAHRAAGDWRGPDGRLRCRICHPPVLGAEK